VARRVEDARQHDFAIAGSGDVQHVFHRDSPC
jgi:hypothetical protein